MNTLVKNIKREYLPFILILVGISFYVPKSAGAVSDELALLSPAKAQEFKLKQTISPDSIFSNCQFQIVTFNDDYALAKQNLYQKNDTINIPYVILKKQYGVWQKLSEITIPNYLVSSCSKFGESISLSDEYLAIGAPKMYCVNDSLHVNGIYVYSLNNQGISMPIRISDPDSSSGYLHFGDEVYVTNTTLAVTGRRAYANEDQSITYALSGSVYIFQLDDKKEWQYTQRIDWPVRSDETSVQFGASIRITNDWLFISAPGWTELQEDTSSVFIYSREPDGQYSLSQKVKTPWHTFGAGAGYRFFGNKIGASDSTLIVFDRFPYDTVEGNTFYYEGAIHIYSLEDTLWKITQTLISEDDIVDEGYRHFSFDGRYLALVNTIGKEINGQFDYVGKVSVFKKQQGEFVFQQAIMAPDHELNDNFGITSYLHNNQLLINNTSRDSVIDEVRYSDVGQIYVYSLVSEDQTFTAPVPAVNPSVKVYPNPVQSVLNIQFETDEPALVSISNLYGQQLIQSNFIELKQIDMSGYSNGIYFYYIKTKSEQMKGRFIVIH